MVRSNLVLLGLVCLGAALAYDDAKNRPVTKVVNLLKDMQNQLEKEAEEDEEVYDKLMCWCETNDKEKTKAIADAEEHLTDLEGSIEELTATAARLSSEISNLEGEVGKNTESLDKATALRNKDRAEFDEEEKSAITSITGLKSALTTLSKHHDAFLQRDDSSDTTLQEVAIMMKAQLRQHADTLGEVVTPSQKRMINSLVADKVLMQQQDQSTDSSDAPQSGAIFGVLKNMKESFEANLASSQKEELDGQAAYSELKAAKTAEIDGGQEAIENKSVELSTAEEKCATDKEDHEDTMNTLAADRDFLAMLKDTCLNVRSQMAEREKTRSLEIEGVSKALAILSSDEAHDTFTTTFNPAASFIQTRKSAVSKRQEKAASTILAAAKKARNPKMALLATKLKMNPALHTVEVDVEKMISDLETEKAEEIKHKDWCRDSIADNEHVNSLKTKDKEFLVARIDDLTNTMDTLEAEISEQKGEIAEMQLQMKKAAANREAENKAFQKTVADQRATQKLLKSALDVLKGFYGIQVTKKTAGKKEPAGPPPPPGFKTYENNSGSSGAMGLIQNIINDAKAMENEAIRGEDSAQKAYEDFVSDTNEAINEANVSITNKQESFAKAEGDKAERDVEMEAVLADLQQLSNESADYHAECDFQLKNFDARQGQRDEEIEALKASVQILHGADV